MEPIFSFGPIRTSALVLSGQLRQITTHKYLISLRESLGTHASFQVVKYLPLNAVALTQMKDYIFKNSAATSLETGFLLL